MEPINHLLRIGKAALAASRLVGTAVVQQNPDILDLAADCLHQHGEVITFGVKNTAQIQRHYLRRITASGRYVWHTIDAMAEGGRAIDMKLLNPLTGRPMTGSSGATALHVLQGINDIGIGTDGGGSVLAPALSLNLCSVMAKGMGLTGTVSRQSTDGISFLPGLGVISHSLRLAVDTALLMAEVDGAELERIRLPGLKAVVPTPGTLSLPDCSDMHSKLASVMQLAREYGMELVEMPLPDTMNRGEAITELREIFANHDLVISFEGPVDLYGLGDSVIGRWGPNATKLQAISGKYLVKIANMVNATAVTIPAGDAASGIVILARPGMETGLAALKLGLQLSTAFPPPTVFDNYFRRAWERRENNLLFSTEE